LHFHVDGGSAKDACNELIRACRRSAVLRDEGFNKQEDVLLVIGAGWNAEDKEYSKLDRWECAWRKAETVAVAQLCALDGHPLRAFCEEMEELLAHAEQDHSYFLKAHVEGIESVPPPA